MSSIPNTIMPHAITREHRTETSARPAWAIIELTLAPLLITIGISQFVLSWFAGGGRAVAAPDTGMVVIPPLPE